MYRTPSTNAFAYEVPPRPTLIVAPEPCNTGPVRCATPVTTPWWGYVLVLVVFFVALALVFGLVYAQMRAFPRYVRLFTAPPLAYRPINIPQTLHARTVTLRQAAGIAGVDGGLTPSDM